MSTTAQRPQAPPTSDVFAPTSSGRQQYSSPSQNEDAYYTNSAEHATVSSQNTRRQNRHIGNSALTSSPIAQQQYYSSPGNQYSQPLPPSTTTSPPTSLSAVTGHSRNRSVATDQYDGPPIPPPRISSQQQNTPPQAQPPASQPQATRIRAQQAGQYTADDRNYSSRDHNYGGDYRETVRDKPRENTATAAAAAAQSRRRNPPAPEAPQEQTEYASQPRSGERPHPPAPLIRDNSEVLNRVIVSDPRVDAQREQERIAESQPVPLGSDVTPVTGLGLVGSEGVEDGGRGSQRRQDYSRSASRRKDVQFGDYVLGQTLGEGEFGKVKLGWKRDGSMQVAIKLIRRETVATNPSRLPKIYREISILRDLAHPNIVRLHEMVETERHIGIILEYASGGELFDYILNHRYLKDPAARRLFAQLVSGVGYLHKKGIVHRDLKLENLLLDRNKNIIITDFGFANTFNPLDELTDEIEYNLSNRDFVRKYRLDRTDEKGMRKGDLMQTSCGSPCYAAPELVVSDSLYTGRKVDVWSCGVILYAMLAGYLPFDDDPANPEGDNINLLYKYITSTPLTFPEYVTPHARDLLRRILVPDPRKRADLFEVARHSWLSEYHHVVSHITSSTTNIADIQNSTVPHEEADHQQPMMNRSASVREPTRTPTDASPIGVLNHQQATVAQEDPNSRSQRDRPTRHTLQPEYVAPQSHTARGETQNRTPTSNRAQQSADVQAVSRQKPLPEAPMDNRKVADYPSIPTAQQKMPPPARPGRDVPRSVSDSTGAFAAPASQPPTIGAYQQVTRPSTGGSMTTGSGPNGTRSDIRLPSRGSYGQPVAPTVAATNVQGRVTQPSNNRGYNISSPIAQQPQSIGQPSNQPASFNQTPAAPAESPAKGHHRRSSTLNSLGERLFGRSGSVRQKQETQRQKNGKRYPPTAMKDPYSSTKEARPSMDSKRSFSFGLGKKRSSDLEASSEKPARRFSLLPASMSLKGMKGSNVDQGDDMGSPGPQAGDFPQPPSSRGQGYDQGNYQEAGRPGQQRMDSYDSQDNLPARNDGQYDQPPSRGQQQRSGQQQYNNYSRPPQHQRQQSSKANNDAYGGTGVYQPDSSRQDQSYQQAPQVPANSETEYRQPNASQVRPQYPAGFNSFDPPPSSAQQGRQSKPGVLQKPNRKFVDSYNNEQGPTHHEGSSGAAKKVMDFFRRRGRARVDEYR